MSLVTEFDCVWDDIQDDMETLLISCRVSDLMSSIMDSPCKRQLYGECHEILVGEYTERGFETD